MYSDEIRVALISNIVFEPYLPSGLEEEFERINKSVQLVCIAYEEYAGIELPAKLAGVDMVLVALNFEVLYPDFLNDIYSEKVAFEEIRIDAMQKCRDLFWHLKNRTLAPIIWLGFEDYCYAYHHVLGSIGVAQGIVDGINAELNKLISNEGVLVDLKRLIAELGINHAYSSKGRYRWNAPYSKELISMVCEEVFKQYLINTGTSKKCLVLDCDNVLWGGILSEDGIGKILLGDGLGSFYQDFQRFLLTLYYHGVILTICSKNDEEDVLRVFREHSGMILKEEHIACFKVNWNNKPDNIRQIAAELNIGLDSMVFVDDSEFEIYSVKTLLSEVTAILFTRATIHAELSCFNLKSNVDKNDVEQRLGTYRTDTRRRALQKQSNSYKEYLSVLETKVDIHRAVSTELARIAELTQRTNRCTNGIRYTVEQLQQKLQEENYYIYSVTVSDKFSNLGLVGAIGISGQSLDLFSLSCRALGRGVEEWMFKIVKENKVSEYRFVSTGKNEALDLRFVEG